MAGKRGLTDGERFAQQANRILQAKFRDGVAGLPLQRSALCASSSTLCGIHGLRTHLARRFAYLSRMVDEWSILREGKVRPEMACPPTCAVQQVGSYLGYSGRGANAFGKAAHDP
jgi:hypothetical protein